MKKPRRSGVERRITMDEMKKVKTDAVEIIETLKKLPAEDWERTLCFIKGIEAMRALTAATHKTA